MIMTQGCLMYLTSKKVKHGYSISDLEMHTLPTALGFQWICFFLESRGTYHLPCPDVGTLGVRQQKSIENVMCRAQQTEIVVLLQGY